MNGKRFSESKARKNGFYLALAVCLAAVGIAAWSTYDAVHSYVETGPSVTVGESVSQAQSAPTTRPNTEDPEAPRKTTSSAPVRQTAGAAVSKPAASEKPESAPPKKQEQPTKEDEPESRVMTPVNAPLYERSSQMIYPLESQEIMKAYSAGAPVYSATMKDWRVHTGMDETAESGEEVRACANGQVKQAYTDAMLGNVLVIEHGDYVFSYCGLGENFLVKEGDIVTKGQAIAMVTAVPSEAADAPHLHLEVRRDGVCMDPQTVIEEN